LRKSELVWLDQVRTLDKQQLVKHLGTLQPLTLHKVLTTLQTVFEPA
jgi:mRNA-degrading endonuclease toxin of MazEF toxin-antitoxin module